MIRDTCLIKNKIPVSNLIAALDICEQFKIKIKLRSKMMVVHGGCKRRTARESMRVVEDRSTWACLTPVRMEKKLARRARAAGKRV